jgi:bacterioferritin-associated ferredoxin
LGVTGRLAARRARVIVCHCRVVSDKTIREHIDLGAATVDDIGDRCGAGARCGGCRPTIVALLATRVTTERAQPAA